MYVHLTEAQESNIKLLIQCRGLDPADQQLVQALSKKAPVNIASLAQRAELAQGLSRYPDMTTPSLLDGGFNRNNKDDVNRLCRSTLYHVHKHYLAVSQSNIQTQIIESFTKEKLAGYNQLSERIIKALEAFQNPSTRDAAMQVLRAYTQDLDRQVNFPPYFKFGDGKTLEERIEGVLQAAQQNLAMAAFLIGQGNQTMNSFLQLQLREQVQVNEQNLHMTTSSGVQNWLAQSDGTMVHEIRLRTSYVITLDNRGLHSFYASSAGKLVEANEDNRAELGRAAKDGKLPEIFTAKGVVHLAMLEGEPKLTVQAIDIRVSPLLSKEIQVSEPKTIQVQGLNNAIGRNG